METYPITNDIAIGVAKMVEDGNRQLCSRISQNSKDLPILQLLVSRVLKETENRVPDLNWILVMSSETSAWEVRIFSGATLVQKVKIWVKTGRLEEQAVT